MPATPGQMLSHYRLVEKIGEGGMGVVWKAEDTVLNRTVAIKVLPASFVRDSKRRELFLTEARLASSVSDANIAQVHDFGRDDGLDFIVMEYVEGTSLKNLLHGRPLPPHKVAGFGRQIAKALSRAHRKQLLHRDLKPGNVIVTPDGEVKVVDFGLAVLFHDEDPSVGPTAITQPLSEDDTTRAERGRIAGTIPYMSPEQVRGERLDARSDIFSLGVVLYEMTTGQRPFAGASRAELVHEIQQAHPLPPHELVSKLPLELERILQKALAARRANRYQSMDDLAVDLMLLDRALESGSAPSFEDLPPKPRRAFSLRSAAMGLLVIVALVTLAWVFWPSEVEQGAPASASLGSSPPLPEPGSAARAYYDRGMEYYLADDRSLQTLDDAIQMFHRAILADRNFAVAHAAIGEAYWNRFDWTGEDSSRYEAVRAVDEAFRLHPGLPEAHLARAYGHIVGEDLQAASDELHRVLEERPGHVRAWLLLGSVGQDLGEYAAGRFAFEKAIDLEPDNPDHHIWLGLFFTRFSEHDAAAQAYERSVELDPNSTKALNNLAAALQRLDRLEEAADALTRSLQIEETSPARNLLGTVSYFLQRYDAAVENYTRSTVLEPDGPWHWSNLGDALRMLGKNGEAREAYLQAADLARQRTIEAPSDPMARIRLGLYCARAGDTECSIREATVAEALQGENAQILFDASIIYYLADREDDALDRLERAVRLGLSRIEIETDPDLKALGNHPRFRHIMELAS